MYWRLWCTRSEGHPHRNPDLTQLVYNRFVISISGVRQIMSAKINLNGQPQGLRVEKDLVTFKISVRPRLRRSEGSTQARATLEAFERLKPNQVKFMVSYLELK
jgi:hypothetical protein